MFLLQSNLKLFVLELIFLQPCHQIWATDSWETLQSCQTHPPQLPQFTETFERFQLLEYLQCKTPFFTLKWSKYAPILLYFSLYNGVMNKQKIDYSIYGVNSIMKWDMELGWSILTPYSLLLYFRRKNGVRLSCP